MSESRDDTLAGKLLVAMPGMSDPRFDKSVIMMCAHDAEHAMGVIINKPKSDLTLSEELRHLGLETGDDASQRAVLDGGPVRPVRVYVLHSEDFSADEATQSVAPGVRLTAWPQYDEHYVFVRRRGDTAGFRIGEPLDWALAAREPLCLLTPDMHNRAIIDQAFSSRGGP